MIDENQNGCLVVGEGVSLSGKFTVPDIASISGQIDGELSAREVLVGATGVVRGKVTADILDIRGEVHQDLISKKSLFIRSSGRVMGNISYSEIEIEKGGDIQGTLTRIESNVADQLS
jgi:cytoskeletal protein CcmA (bactofilin family)